MTALPSPWPETAPHARTGEAQALDIVFVEGLVAPTVIGINADELHATQPLVVDVHAGVPRAHACDTDRIDDTIDYSKVRARILRLFDEHDVRLLEALAERIADILLHEFRAQWVRVRVAKPRKFDDVQHVGVMIERRRAVALEAVGGATPSTAGAAGPGGGHAVLRSLGAGMVPGGA
jgi:7,8-dihydroneopterin aldolase/epimerase/oxygenase